MDQLLDLIRVIWPIALMLLSLVAVGYARWVNRANVRKSDFKGLNKRVDALDREMVEIKTRVEQLPTARDFSRLSENIAHMSGQFEGLGLVINRLHEHMMEKGEK